MDFAFVFQLLLCILGLFSVNMEQLNKEKRKEHIQNIQCSIYRVCGSEFHTGIENSHIIGIVNSSGHLVSDLLYGPVLIEKKRKKRKEDLLTCAGIKYKSFRDIFYYPLSRKVTAMLNSLNMYSLLFFLLILFMILVNI